MTSFLYPRTISVRRPNSSSVVGVQSYSGVTETNETVIATGLRANFKQARARGAPDAGVPADAPDRIVYWISIPKVDAALGTIETRDIIVDDLGTRYVVSGNGWGSFGYRLYAEELQA